MSQGLLPGSFRRQVLGADEAGERSGPEAHRGKVHGGAGAINVKNW
jgi:hypothetical protein